MVFQNYALYPHMTVYENMAFSLKLAKAPKDEIDKKVKEAAEILDITQYLDRKPKALSGGQRQRVALGRAMVRNPKVFLMDEPLSNLDANLRLQMRTEIKRLHQKLQTTFIYVTHDQTEALTMGDRIVVLDKGKIQQIGTPDEIYNHPKNKFVASFIGQMNFIEINVENDRFIIEGQTFVTSNRQGKMLCAIRAEKMTAGTVSIFVKPEIIEMTGGERIVYFTLNNSKCCARIPLDYPLTETLELKISTKDMYFYNLDNGELI